MEHESFTIQVLLFARARDLAKADSVELRLPFPATAADVRQAIRECCPQLEPLLASSALAINHDFADDSTPIPKNCEIALIPPVSGG